MFLESITTCQKSNPFFIFFFFFDIADLSIQQCDWVRAFSTTPNSKYTSYFSHFLNLYLHATNQVDSYFFTLNTADLRILQSDWLGAFWLITQESELS